MLGKLLDEVLEDVRRYLINTSELKARLYFMGDDDPASPLSDWDWRWPTASVSQPPLTEQFDDAAWRACTSDSVSSKVDELYHLFLDQPPDMAPWAEEWSGNSNALYIFLFDKLDERCAQVQQLAAEIRAGISDMRRGDSAAS